MTRYLFSCVLLTVLSTIALAKNEASIKNEWAYKGDKGPAHWANLSPEFALCASGKEQSPVNIPKQVDQTSHDLSFYYKPATMRIVDDGVTALQLGGEQVLINEGHSVQLNFPPKHTKELIKLDGEKYQLLELHFHSPSENQWHGRSFPLEIHFVHQGDNGKLVVVGVFVKGGDINPTIQKIIKHLPKTEGLESVIEGELINPEALLPDKWRHYRFKGSLTTPPCIEGVSWVVMSHPISASPSQIAILRKAMDGGNARPVQPLNDRKILYSNY